jgi:hypothetical protein
VTPELRQHVFVRDATETRWTPRWYGSEPLCVAPWLDPSTLGTCAGPTQIDHIQEGYGRMGKRAPSDLAHMVAVCRFHHVDSGWATSHRPLLREYLAKVNA